jgi:hypothetical protein
MHKEITFEASFGGFWNGYCWNTDLENYKLFHRGGDEEITYRQKFNRENGNADKNYGIYGDYDWDIHINDVARALDLDRKKYKITITVEEIKESSEDSLHRL